MRTALRPGFAGHPDPTIGAPPGRPCSTLRNARRASAALAGKGAGRETAPGSSWRSRKLAPALVTGEGEPARASDAGELEDDANPHLHGARRGGPETLHALGEGIGAEIDLVGRSEIHPV